jgi:hypothetical protein
MWTSLRHRGVPSVEVSTKPGELQILVSTTRLWWIGRAAVVSWSVLRGGVVGRARRFE